MADGIRERVIRFLAAELGIKANRIRADTRLFHDLGCDGDDAVELVEHFTRTFDVTLTNFSFARHFGSEAAYNPLVYLYMRLRGRSGCGRFRLRWKIWWPLQRINAYEVPSELQSNKRMQLSAFHVQGT
jgi:acyl carrier protein